MDYATLLDAYNAAHAMTADELHALSALACQHGEPEIAAACKRMLALRAARRR